MAFNPRTAIGIIDENHYIIVVSDVTTSAVLPIADEVCGANSLQPGWYLLPLLMAVINKPNKQIYYSAVSDIVYQGY